MKIFRSIILVVCVSMFSVGCATNIAKKIDIPVELHLDRTPAYVKDTGLLEAELTRAATEITSNIKYGTNVNGKIEITADPSKANFILMSPETFDSVADLITLTNGTITIIKEQGSLINKEIEDINSLKTLVEFERQKNILASIQWQHSEENFNAEHKTRVREKLIHTLSTVTAVIGGIAYVVVGL